MARQVEGTERETTKAQAEAASNTEIDTYSLHAEAQ